MRAAFFVVLFVVLGGNGLFAQTEYRLFGTSTYSGGSIFSLNSTGTDLITHKVFANGGNGPVGTLLESDGYVYGMTSGGGAFNAGIIFSLKNDGTSFQVLHDFNTTDGSQPQNGLIIASDGLLYGLTSRGGQYNNGVAFRIAKNGTGFQKIHDFLSSTGKTPVGKLLQASDEMFYGMTSEGGDPQKGTIFRLNSLTLEYNVIHEFNGNPGPVDVDPGKYDGAEPHGSLIENADGSLMGMTIAGGPQGRGMIFSMLKSGEFFTNIHSFTGSDGDSPIGDLVLVETELLFGMTSKGGTDDLGIIFSISPSGDNYTVVKDLDPTTGVSPDGSLILRDNLLYGVTKGSQSPGGAVPATLFSLTTDGATFTSLKAITDDTRYDFTGSVVMDANGDLYGLRAPSGDLHADVGSVYKLDVSSSTITTAHSFVLPEGSTPKSRMVQGPDLRLYGTAVAGGEFGLGAIYSITSAGDDFRVVHSFQESEGKFVYGGLIPIGSGYFAGTTAFGGAFLNGVVYKIKYDGTGFTRLHDFQSGEGSGLLGRVALGNDGKLYGLANGGPAGYGTIFRIGTDGNNFEVIYQFTGSSGSFPRGGLIKASNGVFYGVTSIGGANNLGVIFKIDQSKTYTKLYDFDGIKGSVPYGDLIEASDGKLYGMTSGSTGGAGVIYRINTDGTDFSVVHHFTSNEGGHPLGALTQAPTGEFYAMATAEGGFGTGYIFRVNPDGSGFSKLADLDFINGNPESSLSVVPLLTQTITFDPIPEKTVGDADFNLTATTSTGLPVAFYSSDHNVATISGNVVTIVGAGTVTITARQKGNVYYSTASATQELVVVKKEQAITFWTLPSKTFGEAPFELTATSTSGLPVSFSSDNTAVATMSGNVLTIRGTGTATISAIQAGNGEYYAAPTITQQFTVGKGAQTITFGPIAAKTFGGAPFNPSATATSGLAVSFSSTSDKITISSGAVTMVKAGRATIKAEQGGNTNYFAATPVEQSFCINPSKPVVTTVTNVGTISLTSSSPVGNQWFLEGTAINGATSASYTPVQNGRYTVQSTIDDCSSEPSAFVEITITGLDEFTNNKISVYPNPVRDEVYLEISGINSGEATIALMDVTGRVIENRIVRGNTTTRFETGSLSRGMFFFRVNADNHLTTHKFIRE